MKFIYQTHVTLGQHINLNGFKFIILVALFAVVAFMLQMKTFL